MLTFFRHIRKGLLGSGQAKKYLLYAIGEILLVMIGILLALQVNNWNEWRKDRVKEKEVLQDLKENLERNERELEQSLDILTVYDRYSFITFDFLKGDIPYSDTLGRYFHFSRFNGSIFLNISNEGYESLKGAGLDILSSHPLKRDILNLFESVYTEMARVTQYEFDNLSNKDPIILENFIHHLGPNLEPINPEALRQNNSYYSLLNRVWGERNFLRRTQTSSLRETQRVLQLIKKELGEV